MSVICPNRSSKEWKELVEKAGSEVIAYKIWEDAGRIIPTGDRLHAFLEREATQEALSNNLQESTRILDTLTKLNNPVAEALPDGQGYINKKTGELIDFRVSMIVDEYRRATGRFFKGDAEFYAKKGTIVHEYLRYLTSNIANNTNVSHQEGANYVMSELRKSERFKDDNDKYFELTAGQFKLLEQVSRELIEDINDLQKSIDPEGKANFFNEIVIYDEHKNMAGTVDLLVVFSDGSASIYDFKTFSQKTPGRPYASRIGDWDVQLSNYRNMLKHNYGINKFRHTRVIPFRTDYSGKNAQGEWVKQMADGFKLLSAKTKANNLTYLDHIPFAEKTDDDNLNELLTDIRNKIEELDVKIIAEYGQRKFHYKRQKERLTRVLNDLTLRKDTKQLYTYLRSLSISTKNRLAKAQTDPDYIDAGELRSLFYELEIFKNLASNLKNVVKGDKKARQQALEAQNYVTELMESVDAEILDRNADDITEAGHLPGNRASRLFYGIGNFNQPIFRELRKAWLKANEASRVQSLRDINKLQMVDEAFSKWAKQNGYGQQNKFSLLIDENKNLVVKHTEEFYKKTEELRRKAKNNELTPEDRSWLRENYAIDRAYFNKYKKDFLESIKRDLDETGNQEEYDRKLEIFTKFTDIDANPNVLYSASNFKFLKPKSDNKNYINPKWEFIQKHKPVKEYYDTLVGYINEWTEILGRDVISENFIPNVEQGIIDNLLEHGTKNIREAFMKKFQLRENDSFRGRLVDGKPVQTIPILYLDRLRHPLSESKKKKIEDQVATYLERGTPEFNSEVDRLVKKKEYELGLDAKSTDLTASFMTFASSVNEFVNFSEVEPMVKGLQYLVEQNKIEVKIRGKSGETVIDKFRDKVIKKMGLDPELQEIFNSFVNRLIYKQKFDEELFKTDKFSSNKVISSLMQYISTRALGLNLAVTASNFIQGKTGLWVAAREGMYFDRDNIKEAYKAFSRHEEKYANVVDLLIPRSRDIVSEQIELSKASFASRRLRTRTFFLGHIKGDDAIDNTLAVAMSKRWVVDKDGKIKNPKSPLVKLIDENAPTVYDSIKFDEANNELYIPGVSQYELGEFRSKILKQSYKIKGTMTEEHKGVYANSMIWTMFMQFRTWSIGLAEARFGQLKYDMTMEEYEIGRFNAALGGFLKQGAVPALKEAAKMISEVALMGLYKSTPNMERIRFKYDQFLNDNPEHRGRFTIEQFMELQKDKMNGFLSEVRMYVAVILLAQMLMRAGWDDEEESNLFTWNAYQISRRAMLELSFWFSPGSVDEIVKSPLPLWSLFTDLQRLINTSVREVTFQIEGERDPRVKTTPTYYILKGTPGINQVLQFFKYFDQYNPPKTSIDYIVDMFED